jgi:hypothetical protein
MMCNLGVSVLIDYSNKGVIGSPSPSRVVRDAKRLRRPGMLSVVGF